jgi:hypothetical protein
VAAQRFLSVHAAVYNHFYTQRHLISRNTLGHIRIDAMEWWKLVTTAVWSKSQTEYFGQCPFA